jgi:hypothetical protein
MAAKELLPMLGIEPRSSVFILEERQMIDNTPIKDFLKTKTNPQILKVGNIVKCVKFCETFGVD